MLKIENYTDGKGNPAGGIVECVGLTVKWQDGPLGAPPGEPNGAQVEELLEACISRLLFYQTAAGGRFGCNENLDAIGNIQAALEHLKARTRNRVERRVEGTNTP